jgi:hypothetical protein
MNEKTKAAEIANGQPVNGNTGETETKSRRKSNSFASYLKRGTNMASGILEHVEALSPRGLNQESSTHLGALVEELKTLDNDQEILKGRLKDKTVLLQEKLAELKSLLKTNGLIIKAAIPQQRWVDFGMTAKR